MHANAGSSFYRRLLPGALRTWSVALLVPTALQEAMCPILRKGNRLVRRPSHRRRLVQRKAANLTAMHSGCHTSLYHKGVPGYAERRTARTVEGYQRWPPWAVGTRLRLRPSAIAINVLALLAFAADSLDDAVGKQPGPSELHALSLLDGERILRALADQPTLKHREGGEDVRHRLARRGRRILARPLSNTSITNPLLIGVRVRHGS